MSEKGKQAPVNTAKLVEECPGIMLVEMMTQGTEATIERQEKQGQQSFVESETLPVNMGRPGDFDAKAILEAAGVKFLGAVPDDDQFQYVELPPGWKKVATNHPMWSKLVDDKGRERASIFYKAACYDRNASLSLSSRYNVALDYDLLKKEQVVIAKVTDGRDKVIHTTEPIPSNNGKPYEIDGKARDAATAWLDQNFPDWRNPCAYWD